MVYTLKSSHPAVDFGNVRTMTFSDANRLSDTLNALAGLGFYFQVSAEPNVPAPLVTGPSVELVEGA